MKTNKYIGRLMRSTMLAGFAATMAAPAFAQDDDDDSKDTIIVTGSRLNQANLSAQSPVFQVGANEIDTRGVTRVEDLLNILPQVFASQTSELANGATGTSTIDLRGLGATRTLTLLDGKRLPYGSPSSSAVNLDLIPVQLIERVDVVTGGASAVYGSDAVAGVVNFIMRRDFEGIMFDGQVGVNQDGNGNEFARAVLEAAQQPVPGGQLDGRDVLASITFGANTADGRGNVTAFLSYQNQNEIRQGARDYSACAYGPSGPGPQSVGGIGCVGSSTFRRFFTPGFLGENPNIGTDVNGNTIGAGFIASDTDPGDVFLQEDDTFVPFVGGPSQTFNFAPDNFIQRNNERFNFTAMSRYEVTDNVEAYLDIGFTSNTTDSQIAFSGTFFRPFQTNCDNPLLGGVLSTGRTLADSLGCNTPELEDRLSATDLDGNGMLDDPILFDADGDDADNDGLIDAGLPGAGDDATAPVSVQDPVLDADGNQIFPTDVGLTAGYRNVTGDPRSSFIDLQTFRMVGGFRGDLGDDFSWDVFGQYARTTQTRISTGDLSFVDVQDGLFAVDDGSGNAVCRSGNTGCLPFNIFGFNGVSADAAAFAQGTGFRNGTTEQIVLGGTLQGDLSSYGVQLPWAETGVQALVGMEYRRDTLDSQPDDISQIPGGRGFTGVGGGTLPVAGEVRVTEIFTEAQIPLVQGRPFFEELGLNGAYRFSDYTTDGNGVVNSFSTHTFSGGVTWMPAPELRLRGQFQRAVRAPNVIALFTGQNTGLFNAAAGLNGLFDPCASGPGGVPTPNATAAQCAFTGVTAGQYGSIPDNPAGQLNTISGGNPLLNPESSDTYTFGAVWSPDYFEGFTLAVDYFDITVNDAIATVPSQTALDQCIATGDPSFCSLITRDAFGSLFLSNFTATGGLAGISGSNTNISQLSTRGLDIASNYSVDIGRWGSVSANYISTVLLELSSVPIPGVTVTTECKGLYRGSCGGPNPTYRHRMLTTWQTPWDLDVTATWRYYGSVTLDTGQASGGAFTPVPNVLDNKLDVANYLDIAAQWHVRENVTLRTGVQNVFGRDPELSTQAGTAPGNGDTFPGVYDAAGRYIFFGVNVTM